MNANLHVFVRNGKAQVVSAQWWAINGAPPEAAYFGPVIHQHGDEVMLAAGGICLGVVTMKPAYTNGLPEYPFRTIPYTRP